MDTLVLVLHITVALFLIVVVLLQAGKGASIGAAFGGSSQTVFGARGPASFLGKITTAAAAMFMITSLILSMLSGGSSSSSVIDSIDEPIRQKQETAPVEEGGFDPFKAATDNEQGKPAKE